MTAAFVVLSRTMPHAAPDDDPEPPRAGSRVGEHRLVAEIGRGGMSVVYRAVHEGDGTLAAVKVVTGGRAGDPTLVPRFVAEMRIAQSLLTHPGMVKILDFGATTDGAPYLVMELLQGELLRARLERLGRKGERLPLADAIRFARQAAEALSAAHAQGVLLRDVKPDNMMLVADEEAAGRERVKIIDFGLAYIAIGEPVPPSASPGVLTGTALYMAPEQFRGDSQVGLGVDVYALGVVLHEMIAGAPPFCGDFWTLARMHLTEEPPSLAPAAPEALARLVHRMLAKAPTARPDMAAVRDDLRRIEAGRASTRPQAP
jgi:serine/threonine-protein kinase